MLPDRIYPQPVPPAQQMVHNLGQSVGLVRDLLKLAYRLSRDPRVPLRSRLLAGAALAYVVVPLDLIDDAIPGLGLADDLFVVAIAARTLMDSAGPEIVAEHWDGSPQVLEALESMVHWGADRAPRRLQRSLRRMLR